MANDPIDCPFTLLILQLSHLSIQTTGEQPIVVRLMHMEERQVEDIVYPATF